MKQPKTVTRGPWPGKPQPLENTMKIIKETYSPPDKQLYTRGQGKYMPFVEHMFSKPGTAAIECSELHSAKLLAHAATRFLKYKGKYGVMRARTRKDAEDCVKVWIVNVKEEA